MFLTVLSLRNHWINHVLRTEYPSRVFFFDKLLSKPLKYVSITADFSPNLPEKSLRDLGTRFNQCFLNIISYSARFYKGWSSATTTIRPSRRGLHNTAAEQNKSPRRDIFGNPTFIQQFFTDFILKSLLGSCGYTRSYPKLRSFNHHILGTAESIGNSIGINMMQTQGAP